MAEVIDLTLSPRREIIEISSDREVIAPASRRTPTQENRRRRRKKGKDGVGGSVQPSRPPSAEGELSEPAKPLSKSPEQTPLGKHELFFFDGAAAPVTPEDSSGSLQPVESGGTLLLPSHVVVFRDDGLVPTNIIPPPQSSSDDEEYIEYLDYEDRKAPGLVRYFEAEGEASNQSKPSIFKCRKCGAEGDHKTYECPVQICLTCGARDEHSTRSCPISKTCYTCGMKGHVNKTCPNRFSTPIASYGDCDRCGSTEHNTNECPTLWRIYQYVKDEERTAIVQTREAKRGLKIGEGGEGYIGRKMWCYNCATTGHLGDDCKELPHLASFSAEYSAFSFHNIMSGPFNDPPAEPTSVANRPKEPRSRICLQGDWDAGAPADVGKRGKDKDKERLEKRFREKEDEGEDWFNDMRNTKRRGMDKQTRPRGGKALKFGQLKNGGHGPPPSLPTNAGGLSLLARLSDRDSGRGKGERGRGRHEPPYQLVDSIRIRGAASEDRKYSRDRRETGHGPRYKGGYVYDTMY